MKKKIAELRQKIADAIKEMRGMIDKADEEKRSLTADEETRYRELDTSVDGYKEEITKVEAEEARRVKLTQTETELSRTVNPLPTDARGGIPGDRKIEDEGEDGGFRNTGEYFATLMAWKQTGKRDARLDRMQAVQEKREQSMGIGSSGGFALPTQFDANVRQVQPQEAIVRPRAAVIPPGSPPDAKLEFPALDQGSAQNIYGGVIITHTGEGITMTETTAKLRDVSLEPKEMTA